MPEISGVGPKGPAPFVSVLLRGFAFAFSMMVAQGAQAQTAIDLGQPTLTTRQYSAILTIESDVLFANSAFGQRVAAEIEAESAVLSAENRRIEAELGAEEQDLTDRRAQMDPEAFRALADAFNQKVQSNRVAQQAKVQDLNRRRDLAQAEFMRAALPILEAMMRDSGASVILESATVFMSARATDITDEAIARIDAAIGDGTTQGAED